MQVVITEATKLYKLTYTKLESNPLKDLFFQKKPATDLRAGFALIWGSTSLGLTNHTHGNNAGQRAGYVPVGLFQCFLQVLDVVNNVLDTFRWLRPDRLFLLTVSVNTCLK
jgi:hypothetical protein